MTLPRRGWLEGDGTDADLADDIRSLIDRRRIENRALEAQEPAPALDPHFAVEQVTGGTQAAASTSSARWFYAVYQIVSQVVVNEAGVWEMPPDWTGLPDSPTWPDGNPDPSVANIADERVHEICYIDENFNVQIRRPIVPVEEPKIGDPTWLPVRYVVAAVASPIGTPVEYLEHPNAVAALNDARQRV